MLIKLHDHVRKVHDAKIQTLLTVKFYVHFLRCFVFALEICIQSVLREVLLMAVRGRFFEDCNRIRYSGKAQ